MTRVEWQESLTQAQSMLLLPDSQESIEIYPLETGELELVFRGSEDQERIVRVELESGVNTLTLDAARFDFRPAGPVQFAALAPSPPPPAQLAVPVGTSMLFLRVEASGDNGPATSATLKFSRAVVLDSNGNLFIATSAGRVRAVRGIGNR